MSRASRLRDRVGLSGARSCPTCSTPLATGPDRFCGRCGALLTPRGDDATDPVPGTGETDTTSRRRGLVLACVVVLAGAAVTVVAGGTFGGWSLTPPSTEVALTDGRTGERLTADGALDDETAAELQADLDRASLRCEPVGCERWRLHIGGDWGVIGSGEGNVALLRGFGDGVGETELLIVEGRSGDELARLSLAQPGTDSRQISGWPAVAFLPGAFVYAVGETITAAGYDGTVRWSQVLDPDDTMDDTWFGETHIGHDPDGDVLLLSVNGEAEADVESHGEPATTVSRQIAIEVSDGTIRWEADGWHLTTPRDGRVVLATPADTGSRVRAHAISDGRVLWERAASRVQLAYPRDPRSAVVLVPRAAADGGDVLADVRTGADAVALGGSTVTATGLPDGTTYLLVNRPGTEERSWRDEPDRLRPGDEQNLEVLAIDPDGAVLWRTALGTTRSGYPRLFPAEGRIILTDDQGGDWVSFDPDDGGVRTVTEAERFEPSGMTSIDDAGRQVRRRSNELLITADGAEARVVGTEGTWIVSSDPLLVSDGTSLLGVELVATD